MKNVALAIFIALLLTSSAFATNTMSQSNNQFASGTSTFIDQSAVNMGIQVGQGNNLVQNNNEFASVDNTIVTHNAGNGIAVPIAAAIISDVMITQTQANLGVQIGNWNNMIQNNFANAKIINKAVAIAKAVKANEDSIIQNPGASNTHSDNSKEWATAIATAIAELKHVTIGQDQTNLGVQVGNGNNMRQNNFANAEITNVAVAKAKAVAVNDIDVSQGALAGAIAFGAPGSSATPSETNTAHINAVANSFAVATAIADMEHITVDQDQTNLGVQVGNWNDMHQNNFANAELTNVAVAKSKAVGVNDIDVVQGAGAFASANGYAFIFPVAQAFATATASNTANINPQAIESSAATANADLKFITVDQDQTNLGVQVGNGNDMRQNNFANAELTNVAVAKSKAVGVNDIDVSQVAGDVNSATTHWVHTGPFPWSGYWTTPIASATASNTVTINPRANEFSKATTNADLKFITADQDQTNLGVQVGNWNNMFQNNFANAELTNVADAKSKAVGVNDVELPIQVGAQNTANVLDNANKFDWKMANADMNRILIKQNQKNIGVQVGTMSLAIQDNKDNAEIEQAASNTNKMLTDISANEKETNMNVEVGHVGIVQWNDLDLPPVVSHTHFNPSVSNNLVVVY